MQLPDRQQAFAATFAFIMVISMMSPGVIASGGPSVEEVDDGDTQIQTQSSIDENETDDDSDGDDSVETSSTDLNVTTNPPSNVEDYRATLEGELESGGSAEVFFEWREVDDDATESDWRETEVQTVSDGERFDQMIPFLQPDTAHEFRAVARTSEERVTGDVVQFETDEDSGIQFAELEPGFSVWPPFIEATRTESPAMDGMTTQVPEANIVVDDFGASLTVAQTDEDVSVYGPEETVTIDFTGNTFTIDRFEGFSADLVAVETDLQDEDGVGQLTQFEDILEGEDAEVVETVELGTQGTSVDYDLSENDRGSGDYVFFLVNEGGIPIENGTVAEFEEFDNARAIGISAAVVQDGQSSFEIDRPEYRLGETIEFEAESGLEDPEGEIQQIALLYEETGSDFALGDQWVTATVDDVDDLSADNISLSTSIHAVEGPRQIDDGFSIMDREIGEKDAPPGTIITAADLFDMLAGELGEDVGEGGDNVLNVSMVAKTDTGPETTFEIQTQANFTPSDYSIIHVAEDEAGQLSTSKQDDIPLNEEIDPFINIDIDEAASDTTVQPGGEFTIEADAENVGDESVDTFLKLRADGNQIEDPDGVPVDASVEFNARDSQRVSITVDTEVDEISGSRGGTEPFEPGEEYNLDIVPIDQDNSEEINGKSNNITLTVSDEDPANFSVDIDENASDTEVAPNGDLTVVTDVTNIGNLTGTQEITADLSGTTVSEELELDRDQTESVPLTFENVSLDAGTYTVTVASEDTSDTLGIEVLSGPQFEAAIVDAPESVTAGEPINVTATVQNVGDLEGTETVELLRNGTVVASESDVPFNGGETREFEFAADTNESDIGNDLDVTVRAGDDADTRTVSVLSPPVFNVQSADAGDPVAPGDNATIEATIVNDGDNAGAQDVRLLTESGDVVDVAQDVELGSGATTTVELDAETDETDANQTLSFTVATDDDDRSVEVDVLADAQFDVTIDADASDTEVVEGENLTVFVDVENVGGSSDTQTVSFDLLNETGSSTTRAIDGPEISVELEAGETETIEATLESDEIAAGQYTVTVFSEDDEDNLQIEILEEADVAVEITEIDDTVVAGDQLNVTASVSNDGQVDATQNVTFLFNDTLVDIEEDVTIQGGDDQTFEFNVTTDESDIGKPTVAVRAGAAEAARTVTVQSPPDFQVGIDEDASSSAIALGDNATIVADIENVGDVAGTQDIELLVDGEPTDRVANETVALNATATETVIFEYETTESDTIEDGDLTFTVESEDDVDTLTVEVFEDTFFAVDIDEDSSTTDVVEGDEVVVNATIENLGNVTGTQTIELLDDDDTVRNSTEIDLEGEESEIVTLSDETDADDIGDREFTVASENQTGTLNVTVRQDAEFTVEIDGEASDDEVVEGETIDVFADIDNVGEVNDTQEVELLLEDTAVETENVTLDGGESDTVSFEFETDETHIGELNFTVASENDEDTLTVDVLQDAEFTVEIDEEDSDTEAVEGETIDVVADVDNVGEVLDTQEVEFLLDDTAVETENVTLEGGESDTLSFEFETDETHIGELNFTVASENDEDTLNVTVLKDAEFTVDINEGETANAIDPGENLTVNATIDNVGEVNGTQDIRLVVDADRSFRETVDTEAVTLTPEANETVELTFESDADTRRGLRIVDVRSDDDTATTDFSVNSSDYQIDEIDLINAPVDEGDDLDVNVTISNDGELNETQPVEFSADGDEFDTREIALDPSDDTTLEFTYTTRIGDAPEVVIGAETPDDEANETAQVNASDFEVQDIDANVSDLVEGETVQVSATINNTGVGEDTQRVDFSADGSTDSEEITLNESETRLVEFNYTTQDGDAPAIEAAISTDDDSDSIGIDVTPDRFFAVDIDDDATNDTVQQGQNYTLEAVVNNTGGVEATQNVTFDFGQDGEDLNETVSDLGAGENETVTFEFPVPADADVETTFVEVATEDDDDTTSVAVEEPPTPANFTIEVDEDASRLEVVNGSTASVVVDVENVGDLTGGTDVNATTDAGTVQNVTIDELEGGESTTETVRIATDAINETEVDPESETFPVDLETQNDTAETNVTVNPPPLEPFFDVDVVDSNAPVIEGETLELEVEVENRGNATDNQTIELVRDGQVIDSEDVTELLADGNETVEFEADTDVGDAPEVEFTVRSDDTDTTTVQDLDAVAEFTVDITETNDPIAFDETLTVTVDVENVGDVSDEQTLEVFVNGERNTTNVDLDGGDSTTETLQVDPEEGDDRVFAATDDDLDATSVAILDPAVFEVDVLEEFSELEVVEGETASVVLDIENDGGIEDTQDVELRLVDDESNEIDLDNVTDLELGPGEFEINTTTIDTDALGVEPGDYTVEAENEDGEVFEADDQLVVLEPAEFSVDIEQINEEAPPIADSPARDEFEEGETLELDVNMTNFGEEEETRTLRITQDGETVETTNVRLQEESDTIEIAVDTEVGDAPGTELRATIEEDEEVESSDTVDVPLFAVAELQAEITSVDDDINPDSDASIGVTVENVGDFEGSSTVELEFNDTVVDDTQIRNLEPGDSRTRTLVIPEDNITQTGDRVIEARADTTDVQRITIGEAAAYEVTGVDTNDPVVEGGPFNVSVDIENTGDVTGDQSVVLFVDGDREEIERNVEIAPGAENETTIGFTYETDDDDVGTPSYSVDTEDDIVEDEFDVLQDATFETDIAAVSAPVDDADDVDAVAGSTFEVLVEVSNDGDISGTDELELYIDDASNPTDVGSIEVDAGDSRTIVLEHVPEEPGDLDIEVIGNDDSADDSLEVGEPGELEIGFGDVPETIDANETLEVEVDLENVGDVTLNETVEFEAAGDNVTTDNVTRELAGGETDTVEFNHTVDEEREDPINVTVEAGTETITTTVDVEELDDAYFRVTDFEATDEVFTEMDGVVEASANVTNVGELNGTQTVELRVDGEVVNETDEIALEDGDREFVTLTVDADELAPGDQEIGLFSENSSRTDDLTVRDPDPAALDVSIEDAPDDVEQGDLAEIDVTVENIGDLEAEDESVAFDILVDGESIASSSTTVTLEGGNETVVQLSDTVDSLPRAGAFDGTIEVSAEVDGTETDSSDTGVEVDFNSIQSGVNVATEDDTVLVADGSYTERVVIEQDGITLQAEDRATIRPRTGDETIAVRGDGVTVRDFRLLGASDRAEQAAIRVSGDASTVRNVRATGWDTGIITESGGNHVITRAQINNVGTGMYLDGDGDNFVGYSRISGADQGLVIQADNTFVFATLVTNSDEGVVILPILPFEPVTPAGVSTADTNEVYDVEIEESELRSNDVGMQIAEDEDNDQNVIVNQSNIEANDVGIVSDVPANSTPVDATNNWWGDDGGADEADIVDRGDGVDETNPLGDPVEDEFFEVENVEVDPSPSTSNELTTVTATVVNTGDRTDEQDIGLIVDGDTVDADEVELEGGDASTTVSLQFEPSIRDIGDELDIVVESNDDSDSAVLQVDERADLVPEIDTVPAELEAGETLTVDADIENVGGNFDSEQDIILEIDGTQEDSQTVDVPASSTVPTTLTYDTVEADGGDNLDVTVSVGENEDSASVSVTEIEEEEDDDSTPTGGGGAPTPPEPDEPVDVEPPEPPEPPADVTVDLDETVDFEVDPETGQTTATFSEQSAVDSVTFNFEIAGSVNARTLDREPDETGPAPGASAAVSQISVGDELRDQPATIGMRVSQERLAEIDADVEDLRINRFADGEWQGLDTEIVDETDTHVRIQAETPGFSYFAASAVSEPEAAASVSPETVTTDETVELSGSESTDRYGEIVAYDWEIDGETFSGETTTLTVDEPGEYTAELTVTNDAGETDTATVDFTVTAVDDDDVPDDTDEEAFGTGAIAVIVLVIIAILAAAGVAVMRRKE